MSGETLSELRTLLNDLIGDPDNQRWTASKKTGFLNRAQDKFVLETKCLTEIATFSVVAGTANYTLPENTMDVVRVLHNNIELPRTSLYDLDIDMGTAWPIETGNVSKYYMTGPGIDENNALVQDINLYKIPDSTQAGTTNLYVWIIPKPDPMSADSSVPFTCSSTPITATHVYHEALPYGAAIQMLDVLPDQQALVMVNEYRRHWNEYKDRCIEHLTAMRDKRPLRFRGGRYYKNI